MSEKINSQKSFESTASSTTSESLEMSRRKNFSQREVGLNHPDNPSFIRLTDSGDIEIFATPGVGIVINGSTRTISFHADNIKFYTKEDGLKWNSMDFNHSATTFAEPTFVSSDAKSYNPGFLNVDYFINNLQRLEEEESQQSVTITGDYSYTGTTNTDIVDVSFASENDIFKDYTEEEKNNIQDFWNNNSEVFKKAQQASINSLVDLMTQYKLKGYTIEQSKNVILNDITKS